MLKRPAVVTSCCRVIYFTSSLTKSGHSASPEPLAGTLASPLPVCFVAPGRPCNASGRPLKLSQRSGYATRAMEGTMSALPELGIPGLLLADSYKASHYYMYPEAKRMVAYGEFRTGFAKDQTDTRFVFYGLRFIVERFLNRRWTMADLDAADNFMGTHLAGFAPFPWPRDLFEKFIRENDGYFPIKVQGLPEGTVANSHVPVYQITAEGDYARLVTFFETILTQVWYPSTVATLSRRTRSKIEDAFERSADGGRGDPGVEYCLHDFGFRGCCTVEQAIIGGSAHLLSFRGTDTMAAAYFAQQVLNEGRPVGVSVPASEHSVMTSWPSELAAVEHLIDRFGSGVFSVVMDSYDYASALRDILPAVKERQVDAGGVMVVRPDSGDPIWCIVEGLRALDRVFGSDVNSKGFKVVRGARIIQGDGVDLKTIVGMLEAAMEAGFSAECMVFGMGGGLLQKVNRDTMSFATKLCHITYADGSRADVMKIPTTDSGKNSFPGELEVKRVSNVPTVFAKGSGPDGEDMLRVVYDMGPVKGAFPDSFDKMRERVAREWDAVPPAHDPISEELRQKIDAVSSRIAATKGPPIERS